MRFRSQTWLLLCLLLLLAGVFVRHSSNQPAAVSRRPAVQPAAAPASPPTTTSIQAATRAVKPAATTGVTNRLAYRLTNTTKTVNELARSGQAILLENALIDTAAGGALAIPAHLRAQGDPGSYIVQSRGPLDDDFRARLSRAGAEIVAYIPQNAYLVRVSAAGAGQLAALPQTQSVLAYEPYFKLKSDALKLAVKQSPLPEGAALRVLLFADDRAATVAQLKQLGAEIATEDHSPFGPVVTVRAPLDSLPAVAGLSGVQSVELFRQPKPANDLSRVTMGVTTTSLSNAPSYLNLTGSNVVVSVVDFGVDKTHSDLVGRVFGDVPASTVDFNGHGTHMAGIIAGNGNMSSTVISTNAYGSVPGADYRGMAPLARIFSMQLGDLLEHTTSYFQETAYRTNVFISNNSWNVRGENGYDLTAASYDAAVRDALPTVTGSQPIIFVFPAGNAGAGLDGNGQGGQADTMLSPATAKNVISVGALEQLRNITNNVKPLPYSTNEVPVFKAGSDSKTEVADYSSRGNVGVGVEGDFGRFKPDVVAPGSYVISTRSTQWDTNAYYNPTNDTVTPYFDFVIVSNGALADVIFVPQNTVSMRLRIVPNLNSVLPLPNLPIYAKVADVPSLTPADFKGLNDVTLTFTAAEVAQDWFFAVQNPTTNTVNFDIYATIITTNDNGNYLEVLKTNLNDPIGPWYRYESGSSMAAAGASGVLALMQQFFEQYTPGKVRPSPAMMKALLINGARSSSELYDFQAQTSINYQGWGTVQLRSSLPGALTNYANHTIAAPMQIYDQSPADALVTGESRTRIIQLVPAAANLPLRVTLVWTDPPGNPAAGIKLVNDLDLIVTNRDTGEVYFGNDIVAGRDFNSPWQSNTAPNLDFINNVENIYLQQPLTGTNFSVTVVGRRVNVNAVTAHPNGVAQDYALVIASGSGEIASAMTVPTPGVTVNLPDGRLITPIISNGVPLLDQHVGANTPLLGTTNGITNQWHFYIYQNTTTFTNVAFATFLPPTLAVPREGVFADRNNASRTEADIDLYVSTDPALLTLSPAAIGVAQQSRSRGGTESIVYSNATLNQVYYVGVKSEDHQSAAYGILGVSSELPFGENDADGNLILHGVTVPIDIPDGTPEHPGGVLVLGISTSSSEVRRVIVTNSVSHELFGDLFGNLSHNGQFAVLNNHTGVGGETNVTLIYDDFNSGDIPGARPTDGPGSLRDFVGEKSTGVWLFNMVDNAPGATGSLTNFPSTSGAALANSPFTIKIEPKLETDDVTATIQPGGVYYDFVRVPVGTTNLTISVSGNTQLMLFFLRRGSFPTLDAYDLSNNIPAGGPFSVVLNRSTTPTLQPGIYYYAIVNVGTVAQTIHIVTKLDIDLNSVQPVRFTSTGNEPLFDDMVNYSSIVVTNQERIVTTEVGLRIDHPRESDLAVTLVSPNGTRVLLVENRGGTDGNGFGATTVITNVVPQTSAGTANEDVKIIPTTALYGTLIINYDFLIAFDRTRVEYNGQTILPTLFTNNTGTLSIPFGSGIAGGNLKIIMNEGGTNFVTQWSYTATIIEGFNSYLTLTEYTNKTTTPIKYGTPPFNCGGSSVSVTNTPPPGTGWVQWTAAAGGNSHWYNPVLVTNSASWTQVNAAAAAAGGYLATLTSAAENNFVFSLINSPQFFPGNWFSYGGGPAIGGIQTNGAPEPAGGWTWGTGEPWGYTNWFQGLPNNASGAGNEDRLYYWSATPGVPANTWNDFPANVGLNPSSYVMEHDALLTFSPCSLYYLPEETLDKLKGQLANGEWKLELWDNRVGAPAPAGALKSWQLTFVFENTPVPPPPPPPLPVIPPQTVNELETLCVTNTTTRSDYLTNGPGYRLIINTGTGASVSSNGVVCWTPTECQGPSNYTFYVLFTTNNTPVYTNIYTVDVREVNVAPVLPFQSNRVISALSPLVVTNTATDVDCPSNSLTYVLVSPPFGAAINPTSGIITWTPGAQFVGSNVVFTTIVTDLNTNNPVNSPQLSATNQFTVTVKTGIIVLDEGRGTGIKYFNGAIDICANSTTAGGLALSFGVPVFPASVPLWKTNWPSADARDLLNGVTATGNGVYFAGTNYTRTVDGSGPKETKGLVVKFPLTGPTGPGFNGAIWDRQTAAPPGTFNYEGVEGLNAVTVAKEGGVNYIYATGNSQSGAANPGRLYLSKLDEAGNILWTQNDGALVPASSGRGVATLNGYVYAAGFIAGQPYLRKYDAASALVWSRISPSTPSGVYNGVAAISNYLYAVGYKGTGTNTDFLIEKWDESGNLIWSRSFDNAGLNQDALNGVVGVVRRVFCVGYTRGATAGGADAALLEIDPGTGSLLSTTLVGENFDDIANGVDTDVTNSLYIIGESRSFSGGATNQIILIPFPMPQMASFSIGSVILTNSTVQLQWVAPTYEIFQVQWSSNLTFWNAFTPAIYSQNGTYNFTDDGSQTGGFGNYRWYRLLLLP